MLFTERRASSRTPKILALVNGNRIAGVIRAEVSSNSHYAADCFSVWATVDPGSSSVEPAWLVSSSLVVELRFSLDGISFTSLIQGQVDNVAVDAVRRTVRLDGRDLSASLIEARTQETFSNRTASEIAAILASRHGLSAEVTPTTTPVGRYYHDQHDRITLNQFSRATTEWDLLVFLARHEGFSVFVSGTTLYFQPALQDFASATLVQTTDFIDLRLKRSLTLARDIMVTVKSWNSRLQSTFMQSVVSSLVDGEYYGSLQNYVLVRPNLTPDQALKLAQQRITELTVHERVIEATMPADLVLTPRSVLNLYGTNSDFDQLYFIDTIERNMSIGGGFIQRLRAYNSSPRIDTTQATSSVGDVAG